MVLIGALDVDLQQHMLRNLLAWAGGDTCEAVAYTTDTLGKIDELSSPRPA